MVSIDTAGIIIKYKDGTEVGCPLGRVFGKAEGSVYPHDLVTNLKPGQKFKRGDNITYNKSFFQEDHLNPGKVVLKNSMYVTVALLENNATFDDSSSISLELSERMATTSTKIKSITVKFKQGIHSVVQTGRSVNPKDVLLIIEDEITSGNTFDDESLSVLKNLSRQAPKSKYRGTIDKVEVFYHGDKEDMSPSLKALADKSDRDLARFCKHTGKPVVTGSVGTDYRVSGNPLLLDTAEIRIYITVRHLQSSGD